MRRYDEVAEHSKQLGDLPATETSPNWSGYLDLFNGLVTSQTGDRTAGLAIARRGVDALIASKAFGNWWALFYPETCVNAGDHGEAVQVLKIAESIQEQGDVHFSAEYLRLYAQIHERQHPSAAAATLNRALEIAEMQNAGLFVDRIRSDHALMLQGLV